MKPAVKISFATVGATPTPLPGVMTQGGKLRSLVVPAVVLSSQIAVPGGVATPFAVRIDGPVLVNTTPLKARTRLSR